MSLKKLGVALLAVFVLGAIAANSAFAAAEYKETGGAWYTGASPGTKLPEGQTRVLTTTAMGEKQTLKTTVGTTPLDITATVVNCLSCVIKNVGTTATIDGKLEFKSVTVTEPKGCSVAGGVVTTNALTAVLGMNTAGTVATIKFSPETGATFALVTLEGKECPISGTYKVTGTQYAQANNATGVFAKSQGITLNQEIQEKASGVANALKFGENPAVLTGALSAKVFNAEVEQEWAGKEK